MAIAYVQGDDGDGTQTATATLTSVTAGNYIVGACLTFGASSGLTITTDRSDTVVKNTLTMVTNDTYLTVFRIVSAVGGTTVITVDSGVVDTAIIVAAEYSGVSALDDGPDSSGPTTSSSVTGATITTVAANAMIVCLVANGQAATTLTPTNGSTTRLSGVAGETRVFLSDQVKASPGTFADTYTLGASNLWGTYTLSLAPTAGSVIPVFMNQYRQRGN